MHGRRRFLSPFLFAAADEAAGGGGPPPTSPPTSPPPAPAEPLKQPPPAAAQPSLEELMRRPEVLAEIDRRMGETDKRARAEAERKIREELAEQARLAQLTVEERAKQEAATAKGLATKAENLAAEARAENAFLRSLLAAGIVPHDDDCMAMAWMNAKRMAGDGLPVTAETLSKLRTEKPHLFKSGAAAPAPAAPAASPGSNPAEVAAARTLTTQPPGPPGAAPPAPLPEDAFAMTDEQWAAIKRKHGVTPMPRP